MRGNCEASTCDGVTQKYASLRILWQMGWPNVDRWGGPYKTCTLLSSNLFVLNYQNMSPFSKMAWLSKYDIHKVPPLKHCKMHVIFLKVKKVWLFNCSGARVKVKWYTLIHLVLCRISFSHPPLKNVFLIAYFTLSFTVQKHVANLFSHSSAMGGKFLCLP